VPFDQAPLDPFVFFKQGPQQSSGAAASSEEARWLSYNVLWAPGGRATADGGNAGEPAGVNGSEPGGAKGSGLQVAPPHGAAAPPSPTEPAPRVPDQPRRLHIGGETPAAGWEIMNITAGPHVDHSGNANDLSRFPDASFQEVYASHILEHLDYQNELLATLKEWHRVLRPFGTLYLSVPDLDILARLLLDKERLNVDDRFAVMRMMFGGHVGGQDYHGVGLNEDFLTYFLNEAGFALITKVDRFHMFDDTSSMEFKGEFISLNMTARKLPGRNAPGP